MIKHRDIPFYQIPKNLLEYGKVSLGAVLTLSILMDRESIEEKYHKLDKKGYFWVTKAYIASILHISYGSITKYYKELLDAKLIQRRYIPKNTDGYSKQYFYRIDWGTLLQLGLEEPHSCEASTQEEVVASNIVHDNPDEPPKWSEEAMPFFEDSDPPPPEWIEGIKDPGEPPFWSVQIAPLDANGKDLHTPADIKASEEPLNEFCESDLRCQPPLSDSDFDQEIIL